MPAFERRRSLEAGIIIKSLNKGLSSEETEWGTVLDVRGCFMMDIKMERTSVELGVNHDRSLLATCSVNRLSMSICSSHYQTQTQNSSLTSPKTMMGTSSDIIAPHETYDASCLFMSPLADQILRV